MYLNNTLTRGGVTRVSPQASNACSVELPADALGNISDRDRPWDKHKKSSLQTSQLLLETHPEYSTRMLNCATLLDFILTPDADEGAYKLKLQNTKFCRVRVCPICQWRRSLRWKAKALSVLPNIVAQYPTARWLFLTLTVRNVEVSQLRSQLQAMNKGWRNLSQHKRFPAIGWLRSTEITRGKDGSAHPHFHCLLMVTSKYFTSDYIKQADWVAHWKSAMQLNYDPSVNIKAVSNNANLDRVVPEILKYATKASDLNVNTDWLSEYASQMHKYRAIATGGVLKEHLKMLGEEPSDLIGLSEDNDGEVNEGNLYFAWNSRQSYYKLMVA